MTGQRAIARNPAGIHIFDAPTRWGIRGQHHRKIEVDQTAVVHAVALPAIDAMSVMTNATRSTQVHNVSPVQRKTIIRQNTLPTVAAIAQGISVGAFWGKVISIIITHQ